MRFASKYEGAEFDSIDSIDLVLEYAPLMLDYESMDKLEALLKKQRRIEKNTAHNLSDKLSKARELMCDAHRLSSKLEHQPSVNEDKI